MLATCVHYLIRLVLLIVLHVRKNTVNAIKIVSIVKLAYVRLLLSLSRDQESTIVETTREMIYDIFSKRDGTLTNLAPAYSYHGSLVSWSTTR